MHKKSFQYLLSSTPLSKDGRFFKVNSFFKSMINSRKIPGWMCLDSCIKMNQSPKLQFSTTSEVSVLALPLVRLKAWCFLQIDEFFSVVFMKFNKHAGVKIHILSKNSHIENPNFYQKFTFPKPHFSQNSHF